MRARWGWVAPLVLVASGPLGAQAQPACPGISEARALAEADLVFEGVAQAGPAAANGLLATPARFRVTNYIKGSGGTIVSVAGGPRTEGVGFLSLPSAGVPARAGEGWVIYAKGDSGGVVETSTCYGTHAAGAPKPFAPQLPGAPTATPAPVPSGPVEPPSGWGIASVAGIAGLALVMGIGWYVGRSVVGTR